jgi:hypothetical protein
MTARGPLSAALVCLAIVASPPASGYLKVGSEVESGSIVGIRWEQMPIRYHITNRDVSGVSAPELQTAVGRAFASWMDVPAVDISAAFDGFTSAEPFAEDGVSVIGFRARPDMDRTLGAATWAIDMVTGEILESDIFLNSTFEWSVAAGGEANRFDVESIALHEIGHLLGLGHSALGETEERSGGGRTVLGKRAVMFPIAFPRGNTEDRSLESDDRAGISDIYGDRDQRTLGAISGRVTLNGRGLFGAHVTAFNQHTGDLVGGFTLNSQGGFVIAGLAPGLYIVRVEPLDDTDLDSFFDEDADVNIDFRPAYYTKLVAVPAGGSSGSIEIRVQPK